MSAQVTVYVPGEYVYVMAKGGVVHQYIVLESGDLSVVSPQ